MTCAFLDDDTCKRIAKYVCEILANKKVEIKPVDQIMNVNQAAAFLGKSADAVRVMCRRGQIPFHKNGSRYSFSKNEITKYLLQ